MVLEAQKKKRRRKRKDPPPTSAAMGEQPAKEPLPSSAEPASAKEEEETSEEDISMLTDIANFKFDSDGALPAPEDKVPLSLEDDASSSTPIPGSLKKDDPLVLPDIKDQLRKKQLEQELAEMEEEKKQSVKKIKRSDIGAFTKLLEAEPFADADPSFFEEEEYGTVSALLGEGSKPFFFIPSGFLQVGHFIGALVIILMAFVEYPGFPLTNLPTPLRVCFQQGLFFVYAINLVLAVFAVFKAGERGQSKALWAVKTFSVGGLAFDQLTQLPTLEQVEKAKSVKGKRALKNQKR